MHVRQPSLYVVGNVRALACKQRKGHLFLLCWLCGRDQSGKRHGGLISRAACLWLALFAVTAVVPPAPGFQRSSFDACNANWCEISSTRHAGKGGVLSRDEIAQFQKTQPSLLQQQFAGLTPSRKGETEIYTLAIAGWADLDVFVKELNGALAAMASVLPIKGRTVRLVNRRETVNTIPLANFHNFTAAVHAIGNIMDKDNDILILLMTSHGDPTGFALQLPGSITELTPRQVAATLDGDGIKNRVVIVSACYSGIFVPPERQYYRHDRSGCAPPVIRMRPRTRLDLFWRCVFPAKLVSRSGLQKRL